MLPASDDAAHILTQTGMRSRSDRSLTNGNGQVTLNVVLRSKVVVKIVTWNPGGPLHERERVEIPPTLTVALGGFKTLTMTLMVGP